MTIADQDLWGINLGTISCPKCGENMSKLGIPQDIQQTMWGGWTCPKCASQMDKWGNPIENIQDK